MKVAAVRTLPFHAWVLADTVAALRALGVEVDEYDHVPRHAHDWAQNKGDLLRAVGRSQPDALLMADYPYDPFVIATGAPVFATRHSLAARGNTWSTEQGTAHYIATFGGWDEQLLDQHVPNLVAVDGQCGVRLPVGCPWAGPLLTGVRVPREPVFDLGGCRYCGSPTVDGRHGWGWSNCRNRDPERPFPTKRKPIVAWCPTWNDWSPDIADELATLLPDVRIVYRPHYATAWRNPAALDRARALGFEVDDPLRHPEKLLLQADVLVGDVSGIVLLALAVPGAALPIVQVDPPAGTTGAQIEKWGPEWEHRDEVGPEAHAGTGEVVRAIRAFLGDDGTMANRAGWALARRRVRAHLFGADTTPGGLTPGQRLAKEMVCRIG
jgi:hypothetical protein